MRLLGRDESYDDGLFSRDQVVCVFDCRGASISFDVGRCSSLSRPSRPLCLFGSSAPVAFDIHLEDGGMVNEPVDGGQCHGRFRKDRIPFSEGLVGGDQHGAPFVSRADEFEEHAGLGLILGDPGRPAP